MKTLSKLLTLILCFELILGPLGKSVVISEVAEAKDCPAGQEWNSDQGRCVMSVQVIEQNNQAMNCGTDKDCYRNNAQEDLNNSGATKKNGGLNKDYDPSFNDKGVYQNGKQSVGATIGNVATIAIPTLVATSVLIEQQQAKKRGQSFKCNPPSLLLMYAGAAALGLGEIIGYFNHKSKLEDIKEEWDKAAAPSGTGSDDKKRAEATEAQSQAFEFLAQNEEQVAKTAKQKKGFYLAATGLFAAGALAATVEAIQYKTAKSYISAGYKAASTTATTVSSTDPARGAELQAEADKKLQQSQTRVKKLTCQTEASQEEIDADKKTRAEYDQNKALEQKQKQDLKDQKNREKQIKKELKKKTNPTDIYDRVDQPPQNGIYDAYIPSPNIKSDLDKMKRVAAKNLATAKDAEQMLQLMKEYENIEFENYSKVNYLDEEITPANELKNVKLESFIASAIAAVFIPEAFAETEEEKAQREAKEAEEKAATEQKEAEEKAAKEAKKAKTNQMVMTLAGALPLILTQVKFKDGKPVDKETMQGSMRVVKDKVIKAVAKPWTRIAINGVFGTWMGIQSHHMQKQHDTSMERAEMLRKMKEDFKTASGLAFCTEKDRQDPGKPKCYCFTSDNKKNPAREKSQICNTAYAAYNKAGEKYDSKTCLDASMKTDPSCSCKNKKGADGKNTCFRSSRGVNFAGFSPGTFKMLSTVSAPANDLFGGVMDGASIDAAAGVNAAKVQKAAQDMLTKTDPILAGQSKKVGDDFSKSLIAATGGMSMGTGGASALPSSPKAAAAALAEELKKEEQAPMVTASDMSNEGSFSNEAVEEDVPEFGMSEGQLEAQETEIQEIMSEELDMAQSDISSGSDTNIFDLLSNRYKRSGMRRLFDKEEEVKADAPAKTDIAE